MVHIKLLLNYFRSRSFLIYFINKVQHTKTTVRRYNTDGEKGKPDSEFGHPLVIAHRGACGYVPEHTLASYTLAVLMGADYIEPDLVATSDHQIIARHDNELGLTTDVAVRPEFASRRKRKSIDGITLSGWFTEDFTLKEIKTLRAIERIPEIRPGNARFNGIFEVPTLQEIITLARGLEMSQKRAIGIYPEIKHSTYFRNNGLPMEQVVVDIVHKNGYTGYCAPFCIQSFEISNLKELKRMTDIRLMQLYDMPSERPFDTTHQDCKITYKDMATPDGLRKVASYAYCVGVDESYVMPRKDDKSLGHVTNFVQDAHAAGLRVIIYTLRAENYFLPTEYLSSCRLPFNKGNLSEYLKVIYASGIDGFFCDHPDIPIRLRKDC